MTFRKGASISPKVQLILSKYTHFYVFSFDVTEIMADTVLSPVTQLDQKFSISWKPLSTGSHDSQKNSLNTEAVVERVADDDSTHGKK